MIVMDSPEVPDEVVEALVERAHYIDVANDFYEIAEWREVFTHVIAVLTEAGWTVEPPAPEPEGAPQTIEEYVRFVQAESAPSSPRSEVGE